MAHTHVHGAAPSPSRTLSLSVVSALFALLIAIFGAPAPAAAFDEGTIAALTNDARAAQGLPPLARNSALDSAAMNWAHQMAASGTLSHNPSVGSQIPGGWMAWGENVAQGYGSGASAHQGWMNSSGHRANILGGYTDIGVALISAGGTTWAVQVFAAYPARQAAAPPPAPAAPPVQAPPPAPAPAQVPAAPAPAAAETQHQSLAGDPPPSLPAGEDAEPVAQEVDAVEPSETEIPAPASTPVAARPQPLPSETSAATIVEAAAPVGHQTPGVPWLLALGIAAVLSALLLPPVQRLFPRR